MVPVAGLEPAQIAPRDFESRASANSATPAYLLHSFLFVSQRVGVN